MTSMNAAPGGRFTPDLSHIPNTGPGFADFIESRTTAAAEHVAGCHDERCDFCHGDDEPDRDTSDENEPEPFRDYGDLG